MKSKVQANIKHLHTHKSAGIILSHHLLCPRCKSEISLKLAHWCGKRKYALLWKIIVLWFLDSLECLSPLWMYRKTYLAQFSSVAQSCLTLCDPIDCSKPGLPAHHQLPEFTQTHVHWVGDAIQPSHPLSSPSPPALNLFKYQGLFQISQLVTSGSQSIGASASASVRPMNIQDCFPLGWTGCLTQAVFKPQSFIWVRYMWHLFCTVNSRLLDLEGNSERIGLRDNEWSLGK